MKSEAIEIEVKQAHDQIFQIKKTDISEDAAFSHMLLHYFFNVEYLDTSDFVTDGSNDGGIDFLAYDEDENVLHLCQSKYYSEDLKLNAICDELKKMKDTVDNFRRSNTGSYNDQLKYSLQNELDRLPDENVYNIEYDIFTTADVDIEHAMNKIYNSTQIPAEDVRIFLSDAIESQVEKTKSQLSTVKSDKIEIDDKDNIVTYQSNTLSGIQCNVLSSSIIRLYDKYKTSGLFNINIRNYIVNRTVDNGINGTLDRDRDNF